jgi:hypothetical protein
VVTWWSRDGRVTRDGSAEAPRDLTLVPGHRACYNLKEVRPALGGRLGPARGDPSIRVVVRYRGAVLPPLHERFLPRQCTRLVESARDSARDSSFLPRQCKRLVEGVKGEITSAGDPSIRVLVRRRGAVLPVPLHARRTTSRMPAPSVKPLDRLRLGPAPDYSLLRERERAA